MAPTFFISWIYHFWARFWPYFNFVDFRAYFGHFSHVKKGKYKMPKKQQKMASNQKNARKQTHSKIQFYMGICVTSFDFVHFLLWWSYSTCPNHHSPTLSAWTHQISAIGQTPAHKRSRSANAMLISFINMKKMKNCQQEQKHEII